MLIDVNALLRRNLRKLQLTQMTSRKTRESDEIEYEPYRFRLASAVAQHDVYLASLTNEYYQNILSNNYIKQFK